MKKQLKSHENTKWNAYIKEGKQYKQVPDKFYLISFIFHFNEYRILLLL